MRKEPKVATGTLEAPRRNRRDALLLFIICTLMWGTGNLYIINMPLFIIDELHLPEKLAGIMMGTAGRQRIPTMLIAGYYAKPLRQSAFDAHRRRCRAAVLCRHADGPYASAASSLQLLNAIYIGILAGIGMLYFRDLMPGQAGAATTLYTNTTRVGWIIAGSLAGVIGNLELSYGVLDCAGDVRPDVELPDAD